MDTLLKQSNINHAELKNFFSRKTADELSKLTEPCYYPRLKVDYYTILKICNLKEKDIRGFVTRFYKGTPAAKWLTHRDAITNFHIFLMWYCLNKKDVETYTNIFLYYMIRTYTNVMNKQIAICNKDAFKYALDNISKSHLFYREKSIPFALYYMTKQMILKYADGIRKQNKTAIIDFIREARTRISQSVKSLATIYYDAVKQGKLIRQPYEGDEESGSIEYKIQDQVRGQKIVDDITTKICVYKSIDQKAFEESLMTTRISREIGNQIIIELSNLQYKEYVKNILFSFIRNLKRTEDLCGEGFYIILKSMVRQKKEKEFFLDTTTKLLTEILKNIEYTRLYKKLTDQSQKSLLIFIALYISLVLRNSLCF